MLVMLVDGKAGGAISSNPSPVSHKHAHTETPVEYSGIADIL